MKLGTLRLNNNLVLAPMAGITDYPFRQLAREMGCGLTFTEMISAEGLLRKGEAFLKMVEGEHPVSVQLFGSKPEVLAEAAAKAEAMGADAIDLNMGCPAKKVVKTGAGVDLMRFPEKVEGILIAMRKRVTCPLTVKIRSGWDEKQINAVEISKLAEDCGLDAITVHPRTRAQGFRGRADWSVIALVKRAVRIPVIGNGDVNTPSLIKRMIEETGCDGVMIGRGALGNPWVFSLKPSGPLEKGPAISLEERKRMIGHHISLIQNYYEEGSLTPQIRKHLYWYTKGLPNCATFHMKIQRVRESEELFKTLTFFFEEIEDIPTKISMDQI